MRKKNTKLKKSESIENKDREHNTWCIGMVMETNMTNELQNQSCLMQKKQLKIIEQRFQVETYKEGR